MFVNNVEEVEYIRLLDTLARFYNSQITAHVGYELTATAGLVAVLLGVTSTVVGVCKSLLLAMGIFDLVCLGIFFVAPFWPCFKYLYGRLQYYGELSNVVFEHMGLMTPHSRGQGEEWQANESVRRLREMALTNEHGIQGQIDKIFRARLYVSRAIRSDGDTGEIRKNLQQFFHVTPDIVEPTDRRFVKGIIPWEWMARKFGWMKVDVLLLAYKQTSGTMSEEEYDFLFDP